MRSARKFLCLTLGALLLLLPAVGCASSGEEELDHVTLCEVTHSIFYAPQYAAMHLGFFEEEGIELELSNGQGADKVMAAVLSDNVDIGLAGPEAAIYVYNEGMSDFPQVFAQLTQRDGSFLMGREKDDDFSWEQLRGTTVLPGRKGGVPYMTLEYVIRKNGLDPETDVNLDDSIQFALMAGAFTSGTGDYVTIFEPTASMMEAEGKGYIVASVGEASGEIPFTAYFAKQSFMEENSDLIQRFTNAVYKGQQWVLTHSPEEVAQVVAPSFPDTDEALLATVIERYLEIGVWCDTPIMDEAPYDLLQEVMSQAGELAEKAPFDQVVNNTYAEKASA